MSAAPMVRRRAGAGPARPFLEAVPAPQRRSRRRRRTRPRRLPTPPFVALALLVLGAGFAALLGVNTVTSQESFRLDQLQQRSQDLTHQEQSLRLQLFGVQSPTRLAQQAQQLGLRPATELRYIKVP